MTNFFKEIISLIKGTKQETLPLFCKESGVTRIGNIGQLQRMVIFYVPTDLFYVAIDPSKEYVKIRSKQFGVNIATEVRVQDLGNRMRVFVHDTYNGVSNEKIFDWNNVSEISRHIIALVDKNLYSVEYSIWLEKLNDPTVYP